jgi:hypothetical protein
MLPSDDRTQEFFLLAICTLLNALLAEYLSHRTPNSFAISVHSRTSLDVLQTELLRILTEFWSF